MAKTLPLSGLELDPDRTKLPVRHSHQLRNLTVFKCDNITMGGFTPTINNFKPELVTHTLAELSLGA